MFIKKSTQLGEANSLADNENDSKSKTKIIRGRLRSFSLLNSSNTTDFLSSSFMQVQLSKQQDNMSSLDDEENSNVNLKDLKLVLNKLEIDQNDLNDQNS